MAGLPVVITDNSTKNKRLLLGDKGQILASIVPVDVPTIGTPNELVFTSGFLGSTGLDSDNINLNVDGSTTPQTFFVNSKELSDVFITKVTIIMEGTNFGYDKFGNVPALTNGFEIGIEETGKETLITNAKTGAELITQFAQEYLQRFSKGANDIELFSFDIQDIMQKTGGIRIGRGTNNKVFARVNDDLTGLTGLSVRIFGYDHKHEVSQ